MTHTVYLKHRSAWFVMFRFVTTNKGASPVERDAITRNDVAVALCELNVLQSCVKIQKHRTDRKNNDDVDSAFDF